MGAGQPDQHIHSNPDVWWCAASSVVRTQDRDVPLSKRESMVLEQLVQAAGSPVSRDAMAQRIAPGNPRAIDYAVRRLRSKLEPDPAHPCLIHSVLGVGYRFGLPQADAPAVGLDESQRLQLSDRWVDLTSGVVHRDDHVTELTPLQRALLQRLVQADGTPLSRLVLLRDVWGSVVAGQRRLVDTVVRQLRAAIEPHPARPTHLLTERGLGYRLHVPNRLSNVRPPLWSGVPRPETDAIVARVLEHRWVTLVGVAGSGKSWLARQAALRTREHLAGGAWWVDAVGCASVHDLVQRIADVLSVPSRALTTDGAHIRAAMANRPERLVVVDGLPAGLLAETLLHGLATHERLRLLVTSTQAPKTSDSYRFMVPEMPPDGAHALFTARFRGAGGDQDPAHDAVAAICQAVRFNPKAIELAAHRALHQGMSDPSVLIDRDAIASMLADGLRGAPAHATDTLADLSVFQAPFRADDATYVADVSEGMVSDLIDRHLLVRPEPGWLRIYPLVLAALPAASDAAHQRHASRIHELFSSHYTRFRSAGGVRARRACRRRLPDAHVACAWYLDQPNPSPCADVLIPLLECTGESATSAFSLLKTALDGQPFAGRHRLWLRYAESRRVRVDEAQHALAMAKQEGALPDSFAVRYTTALIQDRLAATPKVDLGDEPTTHPEQVDWLNATARAVSRTAPDDAMRINARARAIATAQHDTAGLLEADYALAQLWMASMRAPAVAASQFARLRSRFLDEGREHGAAAAAFLAADMWLEVGEVHAATESLDWVDALARELPMVRAMAYPELVRLRSVADTMDPTQLIERAVAAATAQVERGDDWFAGNFHILARIGWARLNNPTEALKPPNWAPDHTDIAMIFEAMAAALDADRPVPHAHPAHWPVAHALVHAAQTGTASATPIVRAIAQLARTHRLRG